jgi:predicted dehydrogenase
MNRKVLMTMKNNTGNIFTEECPVDQMDAVEHEISSFIQSISSGTDPIVKGEDGLRALALADQIKQHIAERKLT